LQSKKPYGEKACEHFLIQILLTNAQNGAFFRSVISGAKSRSVKKLLTGISAVINSFAKILQT
jgi:hypothetical protein